MSSHEPSRRGPRPVPDGHTRDAPFRAFLRPTIWTLAASIFLVVFTGLVTLRAVRSRQAARAPDPRAFEALRAAPLDPGAPGAAPGGAGELAGGRPPSFPPAAELSEPARASLAIVEETERGHATGAWSVARKRFDPCPGEDVERLAWIDVWSRILKLTGTRAGPAAVTVEQWFDHDGRLRAVRATRGGADGYGVVALLDARGTPVQQGSSGPAPALESLRLTTKNPSSAFFEKPRCEPGKQ